MKKSDHTPGPWVATTHAESLRADAVKADGKFVARCQPLFGRAHHWREAEANARLIAAAPDLLEALRDAEYALSSAAASVRPGSGDTTADEALISVRAAIAKAEGRS